MKSIPRNFSALAVFACVAAFISFTIPAVTLHAQAPAGHNRPASVPEGYLITPFGYFHSSCVVRMAEGDKRIASGSAIQHRDGTINTVPACGYQHFTAKGEAGAPGAVKPNAPTIGHSWIEAADVTTGNSYGQLTATWIVPPTPTSHDGQTLYFFPGLEDDADVVTIIQPVLGWNADFSNAWGIASWNCCTGTSGSSVGNIWESPAVRVNSGDTIDGIIRSACGAGTLSCTQWNISTYDENTGGSSSLAGASNDGQTFNWAFAGAVEVYNIAQCSDYPPNGSITFSNVALDDYNFNLISNPGWSIISWASGLTPQCGYGGQTTATSATLDYAVQQAPAPTSYISETVGPQTCGNALAGYYNPCYLTYTATVSVANGENLYVSGQLVSSPYTASVTEYWGSGQCENTPSGYLCFGFASPPVVYAYANEAGLANSGSIDIY